MDSGTPLVSVVIPVFNAEAYIPGCIACLEAQTLADFEVIFVDDGSSDHSHSLLETAAQNDSRFRLISAPHQNAGAARNIGLKAARGKYISFLDADDSFEPSLLKEASDLLDHTRADIAVYHFKDLYTDGTFSYRTCYSLDKDSAEDRIFHSEAFPEQALFFGGASVWNKMYRLELIRKNHVTFDELDAYNDVTFVLRSNLAAKAIACLDLYLYTYRYNRPLSISEHRGEKYMLMMDVLQSFSSQEAQRDPSLIDIAKAHFLIKSLLMDIGDYHTPQAQDYYTSCQRVLRSLHYDRRKVSEVYPQLNWMVRAFCVLDFRLFRFMDSMGLIELIRRYIHGRKERRS